MKLKLSEAELQSAVTSSLRRQHLLGAYPAVHRLIPLAAFAVGDYLAKHSANDENRIERFICDAADGPLDAGLNSLIGKPSATQHLPLHERATFDLTKSLTKTDMLQYEAKYDRDVAVSTLTHSCGSCSRSHTGSSTCIQPSGASVRESAASHMQTDVKRGKMANILMTTYNRTARPNSSRFSFSPESAISRL